MKLKRSICLLMALTLCLGASTALAASVTGAVLPATMISEGQGKVTITIANENAAPTDGGDPVNITGIYISCPSYSDLVFDTAGAAIAPGESKSFSAEMYFYPEMLNVAIPLEVSYTEGEKSRDKSVSVKVQSAKTSTVTVSRKASSKQAAPGEEITLTYTVTNTGETAVNVASVIDREIGGKETITPAFGLEPGAYLEIPYTYKMGSNTVSSEPVVTYTDAAGDTLTATAAALTLGMVNSKMSVEVEQGTPTADGVLFTLNLSNNGNQRISDIVIKDELGNRVNDSSFALAVGETRQVTYNVLTDTERYVVFTITGKTAADSDYEDNTKSYIVRKYIDPSLLGIEFSATVTQTLSSAGSIEVRFDINNTGTLPMSNLVISEQTAVTAEDGATSESLTEIYRTDVINPGAFTTTQTVYVGDPRDMTFVVSMADPAGNPYTYNAYITAEYVGIRDDTDAATAQQNVIDLLGASVGTAISKALTIALIVLGVLTLTSIVAMTVLTRLEKEQRREAARRRAARRRREENNGDTHIG